MSACAFGRFGAGAAGCIGGTQGGCWGGKAATRRAGSRGSAKNWLLFMKAAHTKKKPFWVSPSHVFLMKHPWLASWKLAVSGLFPPIFTHVFISAGFSRRRTFLLLLRENCRWADEDGLELNGSISYPRHQNPWCWLRAAPSAVHELRINPSGDAERGCCSLQQKQETIIHPEQLLRLFRALLLALQGGGLAVCPSPWLRVRRGRPALGARCLNAI